MCRNQISKFHLIPCPQTFINKFKRVSNCGKRIFLAVGGRITLELITISIGIVIGTERRIRANDTLLHTAACCLAGISYPPDGCHKLHINTHGMTSDKEYQYHSIGRLWPVALLPLRCSQATGRHYPIQS